MELIKASLIDITIFSGLLLTLLLFIEELAAETTVGINDNWSTIKDLLVKWAGSTPVTSLIKCLQA